MVGLNGRAGSAEKRSPSRSESRAGGEEVDTKAKQARAGGCIKGCGLWGVGGGGGVMILVESQNPAGTHPQTCLGSSSSPYPHITPLHCQFKI